MSVGDGGGEGGVTINLLCFALPFAGDDNEGDSGVYNNAAQEVRDDVTNISQNVEDGT